MVILFLIFWGTSMLFSTVATSVYIPTDRAHGFPFFLNPHQQLLFVFFLMISILSGLPRYCSGKESACRCRRCRRQGFDPWVRMIRWRRKWQPTPVFLPRKFHGQRSRASYSPWSHRVRHDWALITSLLPFWVVVGGIALWFWFAFPWWKQSYGFSGSHVWMWDLDHKVSWALKSWCLWIVVLEKTLKSPLDFTSQW